MPGVVQGSREASSGRSRLLLPVLGLIAWVSLAAGPAEIARAEALPGPTVDFTGTMIIRYPPAKPLSIRIAYTAKRVRREMAAFGTRFVTIVDKVRDRTVMLFPDLKRYAIRPLDPDAHDTVRQLAHNATLEKVGPDTVGGFQAVKYKLKGRSPRGRDFSGFLWLTGDNIMVRMEGSTTAGGKVRRLTITLRDLKIGAVDPAVFEIPPDYEKVKPNAARPAPKQTPKPATKPAPE